MNIIINWYHKVHKIHNCKFTTTFKYDRKVAWHEDGNKNCLFIDRKPRNNNTN